MPLHPPAVGIIVIVPEIAEAVELVAVKAGTFPVPLAASPIAVFELVQAYVVPPMLDVSDVAGIAVPLQTLLPEGTPPVITGTGLTVTVETAVLLHELTVPVTV